MKLIGSRETKEAKDNTDEKKKRKTKINIKAIENIRESIPDYLGMFHPYRLHSLVLLLCQLVRLQAQFLVHVQ